jgi:hypothetical protein
MSEFFLYLRGFVFAATTFALLVVTFVNIAIAMDSPCDQTDSAIKCAIKNILLMSGSWVLINGLALLAQKVG